MLTSACGKGREGGRKERSVPAELRLSVSLPLSSNMRKRERKKEGMGGGRERHDHSAQVRLDKLEDYQVKT